MTKKKEKTAYEGKLNEPLPPLPTALDENFAEMKRVHDEAVEERIGLLFNLYSIDTGAPDAWRKLAFELMATHVPGFQYKEPRSDGDRLVEIVFSVEYLVRKHGVSAEQASKVLSGIKPSLGKPGAISGYYFEAKRHRSKGSLLRLIQWSSDETGTDEVIKALEPEVLPEVRAIDSLPRNKRGRPRKK